VKAFAEYLLKTAGSFVRNTRSVTFNTFATFDTFDTLITFNTCDTSDTFGTPSGTDEFFLREINCS